MSADYPQWWVESIANIRERREKGKAHYRRSVFREEWEAKEAQQDEQDFDQVIEIAQNQSKIIEAQKIEIARLVRGGFK